MELVLASASPRRKQLLEQIGVSCQIRPVDICEAVQPGESPHAYVERLALEKAQTCMDLLNRSEVVVLGSDTAVVVDNHILGKPVDEEDAVRMLTQLSGRTHQVMTSVGLVSTTQKQVEVVVTDVRFREISEAEIRAYWQTGEPADKAGSYGIQGLAAVFVEQMKGSYSAVVGLPLAETAQMLSKAGVPVWQTEQI